MFPSFEIIKKPLNLWGLCWHQILIWALGTLMRGRIFLLRDHSPSINNISGPAREVWGFFFPFTLIPICLSDFERGFKKLFFSFTLWILFSPFMLVPLSPHSASTCWSQLWFWPWAGHWKLKCASCGFLPLSTSSPKEPVKSWAWCSWAPWDRTLKHQVALVTCASLFLIQNICLSWNLQWINFLC